MTRLLLHLHLALLPLPSSLIKRHSLFDELLREEEDRSLFSHQDIDTENDTDTDPDMQSIWDSESDMHVDLDALEFLLGPDEESIETDEEDE